MLCACARDAAGRPVVVGGRPERRGLAQHFGASNSLLQGTRADVVIEAAGTVEAWRDAVDLVRPGGTVLFFGGLPGDAEAAVDAYRLHYEELTLRGAFHHTPATVRAALAFLASGAYPWERLINHRVRLEGVAALLADPPRGLSEGGRAPYTQRMTRDRDLWDRPSMDMKVRPREVERDVGRKDLLIPRGPSKLRMFVLTLLGGVSMALLYVWLPLMIVLVPRRPLGSAPGGYGCRSRSPPSSSGSPFHARRAELAADRRYAERLHLPG